MRSGRSISTRIRSAVILPILWGTITIVSKVPGVGAASSEDVRFQVLHVLAGGVADGATPANTALIQARDGFFYGTTEGGGAFSRGTVFRMTPSGAVTVLHSFSGISVGSGGTSDGALPVAPLIQGTDGNFYGTTLSGGTLGYGTVFRITPAGNVTTLHEFDGFEGNRPYGALVQASDGNFYGTTSGQQSQTYVGGTIFRITPTGTFTLLNRLNDYTYAALVQGRDGNFYGTTSHSVFRMTPDGTATVLHQFAGRDGLVYASLIQAIDGSFYGTAYQGGGQDFGMIFRIAADGTYSIVHDFITATEGGNPYSPLIQAADGNFYGTTEYGGASSCGTVFRMTPTGMYTVLHSFGGADGSLPYGGLVQAFDGTFYGMATYGGGSGSGFCNVLSGGVGVVFRLKIAFTDLPPTNPPVKGDVDGDGTADLVLRQTQTGDLWLLPVVGGKPEFSMSTVFLGVPLVWQIVGVDDVDGDGKSDVIWRDTQTGDVAIWLMDGVTAKHVMIVALAVPLAWQIVSVADLDGDRQADLVWRNTQTGDVAVWLMDGVVVKRGPLVASGVPLAWQIVGTGDVDGDGRADLIWRHADSGDVAAWLMDGDVVKQTAVVAPGVPLAWQIARVSDVDADGKADLVWRHAQNGDVAIWLMNGLTVREGPVVASSIPLTFQIVKVEDVDGDGKADLIWRHLTPIYGSEAPTFDTSAWLMDGVRVKQGIFMVSVLSVAWQIQ